MSAFSAALAALHRDPNLSVACTYTQAGTPYAARGVRGQPVEPTFGASGGGSITPRQQLDIAIVDLPVEAKRGDLVAIGAQSFVVQTVERDVEALTWRLTLSEA